MNEPKQITPTVASNQEGCWKTIGVWGKDASCPTLNQVIHCRNCEVFTQAGRKLLERDLPDMYEEEWTEVLATEKDEDLPGTVSVVIFRIEDEWLSLRTRVFAEILCPENLCSHSLPHRNNPILIGIVNVHGEIQLCVSLKELLGIETISETQNTKHKTQNNKQTTRMMVVNSEIGQWVFPVNEISGIHRIHPTIFENVPVTVAKAQSTYTKGIFRWEERHVALLDDELLLYSLTKSIQ